MDLKKALKKLLHPPLWLAVLLFAASGAALAVVFINGWNLAPAAYAVYPLSAYSFIVLCVFFAERFSPRWKKARQRIQSHPLGGRYLSDAAFKVRVSLYGSLLLNTAYAIFQLALGIYHASVWFYSLAAYYIILAVMRFFVLRDVRGYAPGRDVLSEYKRYRFCGVILLVMVLALEVILFYIWQGRTFRHHFITAIAMAAYTFAAFSIAVINVVRYKKYKSPVLSASRIISLAAASVSVLTLETAMLTVFGEEVEEPFRRIMILSTGTAVCVFILVMAVYMIVHAAKEIKKRRRPIKNEGEYQNG